LLEVLFVFKIDHSSSKFINQFRGVGHSTKLENKNEVHADKPDQLIITECSGPEGYTTTALLVLDCAFTLLQEQEKIPVKYILNLIMLFFFFYIQLKF
jgi:hypothetical protein